MNNRRKFLLLIIWIIIFIIIFGVIQIYAKYLSSANSNTKMTIAKWDIKVNNQSIKNSSDITNSIVPIFPGTEHIAKDIIAPTAEGYFDLNFDFTNTDVSFKYDVSAKPNLQSPVKDLIATAYSINDGPKILFKDPNEIITENILLNDPNAPKTKKIRIFVKWNDDETTQTMDNKADAIATTSDVPALFDVNITFTQIAK